jgi:2-C-methyl-D-erythritol 4-phosphate cytidylyltransferase/2-C-methyl-D-erythritol 2,4-cyclodiphosphate synthase
MLAGALILAAGEGVRLGLHQPKAWVAIGGESVLERSARALAAAASVAAVQCVVPAARVDDPVLAALSSRWTSPAALLPAVAGGHTRQASVAAGLRALAIARPDLRWVLVHDAARCMVEPADAEAVLVAARATGAALPVLPVVDTLKEVRDGRVVATPDRARYVRAQTPQAFRCDILARALAQAEADGFTGTDCASLVERAGVPVATCPGREGNIKLTTVADLEQIRHRVAARAPAAGEPGCDPSRRA